VLAGAVYCGAEPNSREHPLAEALGGRLTANILCAHHNNDVANRCDEPMFKQFAPWMFMLGTKRERGVRGAEFRGHADDGEPLVAKPGWRVCRRKRLQLVQRAANGKIKYAKGDLAKLEELKAAGVLDKPDGPVIATLEKPPAINYKIAVAADAERGVLKTALHFVAGFVIDVDKELAKQLYHYVTGQERADGKYVRTLPLEELYFPESWPPRHEIRTYPSSGGETYITVLLFGLYGFQVCLPIATPGPVRYKQPLLDDLRPVFERNDHVRKFGWDDHLTSDSIEPLETNLHFRHQKLEGYAKWRQDKSRCMDAAIRALKSQFSLHVNYREAYIAELQLEAFEADEISRLVHWGAKALDRGRHPWDLPLEEYFV